MAYIIHGATGAQGAPLLRCLSQSGRHVVAAVRHTGTLYGVPFVQTDNASVDSLITAYRGADGVFVHLPQTTETDRVVYARNIVTAIRNTMPGRVIISTSGIIVDEPDSPLQAPAGSAITILIDGVRNTGVSMAVIAPRLYLENLLVPVIFDTILSDGVLRYPVRADFPVSWSSHLDVAEVAARLFDEPEVTGIIGVGQLPGLLGTDLAKGIADYIGRDILFESLLPQDFGKLIKPLMGPATDAITGLYQTLWEAQDYTISSATSAQKQLGIIPYSIQQWLTETSLPGHQDINAMSVQGDISG